MKMEVSTYVSELVYNIVKFFKIFYIRNVQLNRGVFKIMMIKLYDVNGDTYVFVRNIPFTQSYPYELVYLIKKNNFETHSF